jgi:hypothetical protein
VEDAMIQEDGLPLYVVEVKGVSGGVKREYINQVDSHRERRSLTPEVPGWLIINDFMGTEGLEKRIDKTFDSHLMDHAKKFSPIQPKPMQETSRLLFPSFRAFIL